MRRHLAPYRGDLGNGRLMSKYTPMMYRAMAEAIRSIPDGGRHFFSSVVFIKHVRFTPGVGSGMELVDDLLGLVHPTGKWYTYTTPEEAQQYRQQALDLLETWLAECPN